jgi:hypothetical protein
MIMGRHKNVVQQREVRKIMQSSDRATSVPSAAAEEAADASPVTLSHLAPDQSRRQFVSKLRLAAAVPVVVGLSLSWTTKAEAY